ncbi:hypothetical protein M9H77_23450 [Catharanthus roseus]|uniref:Uncharacterized protein n=1 Tax=Catharanthus roseus TaxID=4058 RepID=A0ACC0AVU7_CATRO|nr:hypothetical protein M9H77_23450 [Catharanthus roseus]
MIAYLEDTLKSKIEEFDGQRKLPKLFTMCSIVKEQPMELLWVKIGKVFERSHLTADHRVARTVTDRILPGLLLEVDNLPRTLGLTLTSPTYRGYLPSPVGRLQITIFNQKFTGDGRLEPTFDASSVFFPSLLLSPSMMTGSF